MGMTFEINSLEDMCDVMCDNIIQEKSMSKYEALIELRKIYTNPLLDLSLKAKLKQIIQVLEEEL